MAAKEMTGRPLLPFYIVVDVSYSMSGPSIDAANRIIGEVANALAEHPLLADKVRIGVISFSDEAEVVLPIIDLTTVTSLPQFAVKASTSYLAAFELLMTTIDNDITNLKADGFLVHRPLVFFVTDGDPTDLEQEWKDAFARLTTYDKATKTGNRRYPNVVPFGVAQATQTTIDFLVHPKQKMRGYIQDRDQEDPAAVIRKIAEIIVQSVLSSAESAGSEGGGVPAWDTLQTEGLKVTKGTPIGVDYVE